MPPSQGDSSGPIILAFHRNRLSSLSGAAEQPSGGVDCISFKSLMRRVSAALEGPDELEELDPLAAAGGAVPEEDEDVPVALLLLAALGVAILLLSCLVGWATFLPGLR